MYKYIKSYRVDSEPERTEETCFFVVFGPLKKKILLVFLFSFLGAFCFFSFFNRTAGGLGTSSFVSRSYTARKKYKITKIVNGMKNKKKDLGAMS